MSAPVFVMNVRMIGTSGTAALLLAVAASVLPACSATDDRPAEWGYISPAVFAPNCATASCHSPAAAVSGLDFSDADRGYTSLTGLWIWIVDPAGTEANGCRNVNGTVVCQRGHRPLVTAFNPAASRLVNMLRARGAPRMPPDRPLPEADIALVERWILAGARRDPNAPAAGAAAPTDGAVDSRDGSRDGNGDGSGDRNDRDAGVDASDSAAPRDASTSTMDGSQP